MSIAEYWAQFWDYVSTHPPLNYVAYALFFILTIALLFCVLFLPDILRRRRSLRSGEVITEPVEIAKISYSTGLANPQVWFKREGEKRLLRLETLDSIVLDFPPVGTKGTLVRQGKILCSFSWEDKTILQENPHTGAKQ